MVQLNEADIAASMLTSIPEAHGQPMASPEAPLGVSQPPAQPIYTDADAKRHGGVVGRLLGMGYRDAYGTPLENDVEATAGDVFGEVFGLLSRVGNRWVYVGTLLGVTVLPLAGLMAWRLFKAQEKPTNGV